MTVGSLLLLPLADFSQPAVIILMTVKAANVWGSAAAGHTHIPLPCSLALLLLGFPTHVQVCFILFWDSSGGDLHLLDKIGNFWALQLTVLSLVNMTCKMRDLVVAIKFYMQYCVSSFWVGQSPEVCGAESWPKALTVQNTKLLVLTEPLKHHPL